MSNTNDLKHKRRKAQQTIRRYLGYYRRSLIVGGGCLVVSNALLLVDPWILKLSIDGLQEGITRQRLGLYAIVFVGVTIVSGVFRFLMRWIMIGASRRIEMDIRADFLSHLQTLSPSFYGANRTGDLMALATNDLNAVRALTGPGVMYSLNTVVVGGFALSLMVYLSWKLTIVSLLPMGFLAIGMYHSMKLIHQYFEKVQERFGELNSRAQENLSGIRVVKAYAREEYESAEFEKQSSIYMKANMKLFKIQSLLQPLLTSVAGLGALFVIAFGGRQVIDDQITLGTFVAFSGYLAMLIWPTIALGWVMNILERGLASMQRINAVMETPSDIIDIARTPERGATLAPADCSIRFENVRFSYGESRGPIIEDMSFDIADGETVAIVGPTGSGKSTLVSLILRLYEPDSGRILVGGVPIENIPLRELRDMIGLIPQDIFLFSQSISDNVAFGVATLDQAGLDRLTKLAAIHDEIQDFPNRYETMIGERGINLSGGQKQRLAIARALAKSPGILILDDALSSVDTDTEDRILKSLLGEMTSRTAILISHRISTVREADRILVLEDGRLIEQGAHDELVKRGGLYAGMFEKQQIMYRLERS